MIVIVWIKISKLETNYFGSQNLVANVSDKFRNQFIIETILNINLETNYNYFLSLKLVIIQIFSCSILRLYKLDISLISINKVF